MAKTTFELTWNYDKSEYRTFLEERGLIHLKKHNESAFRVGDAVRSKSGHIARVVDRFANYENYSIDVTVANNSLTREEMSENF